MTNHSVRHSALPFQAKAELELIDLIFNAGVTPYPWNPADPEMCAYFEALEQQVADNWTADEFAPYVKTLSGHFDQVWAAYPSTGLQAMFPTDLFQRFLAQLPTDLLEGIVQQTKGAIAQSNNLADQLVLAVESLLPAWNQEDLRVLARPFAYAMRDGADSELLEGTLQSLRCASWEDLSEIEQARLSLAIARYVISQDADASHPSTSPSA